jgi:hypothetical protein
MRFWLIALVLLLPLATACHPGPVIGTGSQPSVGGTIAGIVTGTNGNVPLSTRRVSAIDVNTGSRYEATTGANGGFTIKVPEGTYRLEVELRAGETVAKQPDQTRVNNGDLDSGRDFVVTVKPPS